MPKKEVYGKDILDKIKSGELKAKDFLKKKKLTKKDVEKKKKEKEFWNKYMAGKLKVNIPQSTSTKVPKLGNMYMFNYKAKTFPKPLKFYDKTPLSICIATYGRKSWLGLNLHYLPFKLRKKLLKAILIKNRTKMRFKDESIEVDYKELVSVVDTTFKLGIPAIKKYLLASKYTKSGLVSIPITSWVAISEVENASWEFAPYGELSTYQKNRGLKHTYPQSVSDVYKQSTNTINSARRKVNKLKEKITRLSNKPKKRKKTTKRKRR